MQQSGGTVTATQILFGAGGSYNLDGGLLRTSGLNAISAGNGLFNFNGGTLQATANFAVSVGTNQVRNGGAKIDTNGFNVSLAAPLIHSTIAGDAASDGGLTKSGAGTLTLAGANTYTGGTTISGGTLQLGNSTSANSSVLGNIINNATLAFANPNAQTFAGVISGSGGLVKSGAGTLTFSGASPNTYAGDTFVNNGTLVLAKTNVGAPANFGSAMGGNLFVSSGATVRYGADSQVRDDKSIINAGTLDLNGFAESIVDLTVNGGSVITGAGYLNVRGTIAANNSTFSSYAGNLHFEAPTANAARNISVAAGGLFDISGVIANGDNGLPAQLNKQGGGSLIFSGNTPNTYTGDTVVNGGTLVLSKRGQGPENAFGSAMGGNLTVNGGTIVRYGASSQVRDDKSITVNAGGLLDLNSFAESITNLAINGGAVTTGTGYVNVRGSVTADNSATSTYSGSLHLEAPTANGAGTISVANGGTLSVPGSIANGDNGLATQLNKTGGGTLNLSGSNLYSGGTVVQGGTLLVNNPALSGTGSGAVAVQNGATLGGGGRIAGPVSVQAGGTLAPGNSPGQLTIANDLSLGLGSTLSIELGGTNGGTGYDQVLMSGQLTLAGNLMVSLVNGFTPGQNQVFAIVIDGGSSPVIGNFANAPGGVYASPAGIFSVNYAANADGGALPNDITLTYLGAAPVPEPATWGMLFIGAALLAWRPIRRHFQR